MRKRHYAVIALSIFLLGGCAATQQAGGGKVESDDNIVYVCPCGDACSCGTISKDPGTCACKRELTAMRVLRLEGKEGLLCTCGPSCGCTIDASNPKVCGCGKPVKRVDLKGFYVCNCGKPTCVCTVSDEPGLCRCGKELKKF